MLSWALCRAISRWPPMLSVQRIMSGFISRYDSRSRGVTANCFFVSLPHKTHETDGIKDDGSNCRQIGRLVFKQLNIPFGEINS